jgi:hypothetical protein
MPSTTTVMQKIWDTEGILVKFKEGDKVPAYNFKKRFPNNRNIQDFIRIRLCRYSDCEPTVMKSWKRKASNETLIDSLRQGYNSATLELIEKFFENLTLKENLIKTERKFGQKVKRVRENLESAMKEEKSAKEDAEASRNNVRHFSEKSADTAEKLEITQVILKNTKYICDNLEKKIKQLCQSDASLAGQGDKITRYLKEKLLIKETADRLQQILLNLPE